MDTIISADGTPIAFWRSGNGAPLVLIHGATADHTTTWRSVLTSFERNFTVYAMDRRGRGGSGDHPEYSIGREAEDIAALVNSIGEPVNVLAHSYGGLCAFHAALLTKNINRLILYESVPVSGRELYPPGVIDEMQALIDSGKTEEAVMTMFRKVVMMPEEELALMRAQDAWKVRIANAGTAPREMKVEQGFVFDPAKYQAIRIPTLFLVGGDSPPRELANARTVAGALKNGTVVILPGQQHAGMHTAPELFVRAVMDFLTKE